MKMEGKKRVLTVLGKVVGEEVKRREEEKGPFCTGWFYQPKRPNTKK
ncbi:cyclic lactone autoinducer peptide [Roseburia sp. 499]|nr:cyclic lactone autoinducer peptide [Roseburia sp. 499]WVK69566.1 cyclic lactone autoinducer peptide [Roseburia sp. 499]